MTTKNAPPVPYKPKPFITNTVTVPEKTLHDDDIGNMFIKIANGNHHEILEEIYNKNVSMSIINKDTGETPVHYIIKNTNISEMQKMNLIELVVKYGARIDIPNAQDVTPLHLAVKFQHYKIVDYLLKNNARVDTKDSQSMTPLHYAVVGGKVECPQKDTNKPNLIIPVKKSQDEKPDSAIATELYKLLTDFLFTDEHTKIYIEQIKECIENVEKIYSTEFIRLSRDTKNDIILDLLRNEKNNSKERIMFDKILSGKKSIIEIITNKIKSALEVNNPEIKPNLKSGWSPDVQKKNIVVGIKNIEALLTEINNKKTNLMSSSDTKINRTAQIILRTEINKLSNIINNTLARVVTCIEAMYQTLSSNVSKIPLASRATTSDQFKNLCNNLIVSLEPAMMYVPSVEHTTIFHPLKNYADMYEGNTNNLPDSHKITDSMKTDLTNVKIKLSDNDHKFISDHEGVEGFPKEIYLVKSGVGTNGMIDEIIKNRYTVIANKPVQRLPPINYVQPGELNLLSYFPSGDPLHKFSKGLYYDHVLKFNIAFLIEYVSQIHDELTSLTFTNKSDDEYEKISKIIFKCLNALYTINDIMKNHITQIKNKTSELAKIVSEYSNYIPSLYNFVKTETQKSINTLLDFYKEVENKCGEIYSQINDVMKALNERIECYNFISACKALETYYDNSNNFKAYYENNNVNKNYDDIFYDEITKINPLPELLNEFMKKYNEFDFQKLKAQLVSDFVPQVTSVDIPIYVNGVSPTINPKVGFIMDKIDQHGFKNFWQNIPTNPAEHTYPNLLENIVDYTKTFTIGTKNIILENPQNNKTQDYLKGIIGNIESYRNPKNKLPCFSIGPLLNDHFSILKYIIIIWVLKKLYDGMNDPAPAKNITLIEKAKEIHNNIKNIVQSSDDDYNFILVLAGTFISKVLVNFMKDHIEIITNKFILKLLNDPQIPLTYIDIFKNTYNIPTNLNENNIVISFPNKDFSLDMNEIFDDLISLYMNPMNLLDKTHHLISYGNLNEYEKDRDIHKLLTYGFDNASDKCYKIDESIIKLLINKSGNIINLKDIRGKTPLAYAVEMQNINVINLLIKMGSFVTYGVDSNGKTLLQSAFDEYAQSINNSTFGTRQLCKVLTQDVTEKIKKSFPNILPKYSKILLHVAIYMLNHQLFMIGEHYPKRWTYQLNTQFKNALNISCPSAYVQLLNTKFTNRDVTAYDVSNEKIDALTKKIQKIDDANNNINKMLAELQLEYADIVAKGVLSHYDTFRLKEINDKMTQIASTGPIQKTFEENEKKSLVNAEQVSNIDLNTFISNNSIRIKPNELIDKLYDSIFIDVINNDASTSANLRNNIYNYNVDIKTYPTIWNTFFKTNINENDHSQVIDNINKYQKSIINDNNLSINDKISKLSIICEYYQNILVPYAQNYFDLPDEYNDINYPLTHVMNIIIHVVKRIICVPLMGVITKSIIKHVISIFPNTDHVRDTDRNPVYSTGYQEMIKNTVIEIIDSKGNSKLMKYIFTEFPEKIVKVILNIYNGDDDSDKELDRDKIFNFIIEILNTVTQIGSVSKLSSNINEHIFPYYKSYIESFVKIIKGTIDNYLKNILYQGESLNILMILNKKALAEKI